MACLQVKAELRWQQQKEEQRLKKQRKKMNENQKVQSKDWQRKGGLKRKKDSKQKWKKRET